MAKKSLIRQAADQFTAMSAWDHFVALVKAAVSAAPCVGGPLSSLIGDYVPLSRQQAAETAAQLLAERLAALEGRTDPGAVNEKDFAELFNKFERIARGTNREEKLNAAANLLANAVLKRGDAAKSAFEELDHLMHCVDTLSAGAISALGAAIKVKPPRHGSGGDVSLTPQELAAPMELGGKLDLLMGFVAELRSLNLVHVTEGLIGPTYESSAIRVTPMGVRFAQRFIEGRM